MWWDIMLFYGKPDDPAGAAFDAVCLEVMMWTFYLKSDACTERALHGLGHWHDYAAEVGALIDGFVVRSRYLRPELRQYARLARNGAVLRRVIG
jgi:hypothetical protein